MPGMATDTMPSSLHFTPLLAITIGWFDLVFLLTLGAGFWFGRHRGASNEYYPLVQWFAVCVAGAFLSGPLGSLMHKWLGLSQYTSQIFGYFVGGGMIFIVFIIMNVLKVNEILDGDFFGKGETHVGGVFGSLKFLMLLMIPLAIVHGRKFSEAQINGTAHGKVYAGIFQQSMTGSAIANFGSFMLIKPAAHTQATKANSVGAKKNRQMDAASSSD